jgi:hypothetical protein
MHLLSRSPFQGDIKALEYKAADVNQDSEEEQPADWQVVTALDLVNTIHDLKLGSKDRVLLVTMLNLENPQGILRSGVDSLTTRFFIRTNMILGVEKIDKSMREASSRSVFLIKGVEVVRAGEQKDYEFKGEVHLPNGLDVAILGRFSHVNRHHGDLEEETMELLIAKLHGTFVYASRRKYTHLLVSVGQYEWEGIPTHALLEALRRAHGLGPGGVQPILVLDRCFDERDREDARTVLNSSTI